MVKLYLFPSDYLCSLKQDTKVELAIIQNICNLKFNLGKTIYIMEMKTFGIIYRLPDITIIYAICFR